MYIYVYVCVRACACVCVDTYTHTHTHKHTHTHSHTRTRTRTKIHICIIIVRINHIYAHFAGPNDGVVSVSETLLDSPHSHLTLWAPHNLLPNHPAAVRAVLSFIASQAVPGAQILHRSAPDLTQTVAIPRLRIS